MSRNTGSASSSHRFEDDFFDLNADEPRPSTSRGNLSQTESSSGESSDHDQGSSSLDSDSDEDFEGDDDVDEEELDFVSVHDSSIDSDEPLANHVRRSFARNAPGTESFVWNNRENVPRRHGFSGQPGVTVDLLDATSTPKEILDCFLTPELWSIICEETNRYASQHPVTPSRRMRRWEDTTVEELQAFFGLRLTVGMQENRAMRDYWSTKRIFTPDVFPEMMTRDRFDLLTSRLHFADNDDPRAADDRQWKLRHVIDILNRQFQTVYVPLQKVTVDESLWAYRGRHHAVQCIRTKRARFGMKVYKVCCSEGSAAGYTSAFNVYMGQDRSPVPASMKAVVDLMEAASLFNKGYELYLDSFYSSPELFHYLQSRRTNAIGTVRLNRKHMPKDLKVVRPGDVDFRSSKTGMLVLSWKDRRKQVSFLSTVHTSAMTTLPPNRRGEVREKPQVAVDYQTGMMGVDLSDQYAVSYATTRKTNKWYVKMFFNLFDMAIVNSLCVHKILGGRMSQKQFRVHLSNEFLRDQPRRRGRTLRPPPSSLSQLQHRQLPAGHFLVPGEKYRRCKECRRLKNKRKETRYICVACNIGLCPGECFNNHLE